MFYLLVFLIAFTCTAKSVESSILKNVHFGGRFKKYPFDVAKTPFMCKQKAQTDKKKKKFIKISRYVETGP